MIKRSILIYFFSLLFSFADDISKENFLNEARRNLIQHSWINISGQLFFRPHNKEVQKKEIIIKTQMNFNELTLQVSLNDKETLRLYQKFDNIYQSKEIFNNLKKENSFKIMGLNIVDLSLSFMYWDLVKENKSTLIGLHRCRVLLMRNPDNINFARLYISKKYLAPLKVEWFIDLQKLPYQTLEFKSFIEQNNIWAPKKIRISNQKGRISIEASVVQADAGQAKVDFFK